MASSFCKTPSLGYRDALNELARSQLEVSARLRSLLRLSPAGGVEVEQLFTFSDESAAAAIVAIPMDSNGKVDGGHQKKRSYYRCAYRDERGCVATKQVQQKEKEDPPLFLVTCSNEHTCNYLSSLFLTEQTLDVC